MKERYIYLIIIINMCVVCTVAINGLHTDNVAEKYFRYFNVIEARMESPSLIIEVDSHTDLTRKMIELNTTTIYDTNQGLAVLDTQNNIAYLLRSQPNWYGVHPIFGLGFVVIWVCLLIAWILHEINKEYLKL